MQREGTLPYTLVQPDARQDDLLVDFSAYEGKTIRIIVSDGEPPRSRELVANEPFHITPGLRHRMIAIEDTDVLEVSTPHLDDVVRLKDLYGREGTSAP